MNLSELIKLADAVYSPNKDDWELKQALLHFDRAANPATVKRMAELLMQCREALVAHRESYINDDELVHEALAALDAFEKK
jgi:hypothetical protein